jgi:site-specific recombinase XerD
MSKPTTPRAPPSFAALVQTFFSEHLTQQRAVSPCTVATYRDAFVLFLNFATGHLHKQPTAIRLDELTPTLILAFLDHLEHGRGNTVRTRNARLAMLRTFLKFAGHRDVGALGVIEQALGVPMKRFERPILGFLAPDEMMAIIGKPGATWTSRRDHLLWQMLYNTGARVSEIIGVCVCDVLLDGVACVHLHGKGRKQRTMPLWRSTVKSIRTWLKFDPELSPTSPLLPNREGHQMTRTNVAQRLALAVSTATPAMPSLGDHRISPHTIRHTTAMHLLQSGESIEGIALWLGHESPTTTHQYTQANLAMKESTLAKLKDPATQAGRFRASDSLLDFLKKL